MKVLHQVSVLIRNTSESFLYEYEFDFKQSAAFKFWIENSESLEVRYSMRNNLSFVERTHNILENVMRK